MSATTDTSATIDTSAPLEPLPVREALSRCYPHGLVTLAQDQVTALQCDTSRRGWRPAPWWRKYAPHRETETTR